MDMLIRPAGPADAEDIADVQRLSWQAAYGRLLSRQSLARAERTWDAAHWRASLERIDSRSVTLVLDNEIAGITGFAVAGPRRRGGDARLRGFEGEIYLLYLLPWVQGAGYGRNLLAAMGRVLRAQGINSAMVWALASNLPAIAFYRKLHASLLMQWRRPFFGEPVEEVALGWSDIEQLARASHDLRS